MFEIAVCIIALYCDIQLWGAYLGPRVTGKRRGQPPKTMRIVRAKELTPKKIDLESLASGYDMNLSIRRTWWDYISDPQIRTVWSLYEQLS